MVGVADDLVTFINQNLNNLVKITKEKWINFDLGMKSEFKHFDVCYINNYDLRSILK